MRKTTHELVVDGLVPRRVERPETAEGVAEAVRRAAEVGEAVIPWGAGTKQGLGNVPRAYDVALDLSALDQVLEYEPADLVVTVQAGIPLAKLQERLAEAGQFFALDPPYASRATLGGTLAANASGPSRLLYGTARDLVLGLRVATTEGELIKSGGRVVKNVVGYDLNKMHIGGLGTLGVIVEATLKVHPLPAAEATVLAAFRTLEPAHAVAGRIARSVLYPRAVELVHGPLDAPDGPALPVPAGEAAWRVLVWAAGSPATVDRQVRDAIAWCHEAGATEVVRLEGHEHRRLWNAVREFGRAGTNGPPGPSDSPTLLKLTCRPSQLVELVPAVERAAQTQGAAPPPMVAHAGSGVLYIAPGPLEPHQLQGLVELAAVRGGSGVIEQAPLAVRRALDVWGPTRGDFWLMQRLKQAFDPQGTLNPGRFVGRL
jgi:glycolate oxidase FAD binding subunit